MWFFPVFEDREGAIWDKEERIWVLNRLKDGKVTVYTTRDGLPSDSVFSINQDARRHPVGGKTEKAWLNCVMVAFMKFKVCQTRLFNAASPTTMAICGSARAVA